MSLRFPASKSIDNAVTALWNAGYVVSVAAGNDDTDSCNSSPSRSANVSLSVQFPKTWTLLLFNIGCCMCLVANSHSPQRLVEQRNGFSNVEAFKAKYVLLKWVEESNRVLRPLRLTFVKCQFKMSFKGLGKDDGIKPRFPCALLQSTFTFILS